MGDAFNVYEEFSSLLTTMGYTSEKATLPDGTTSNKKIYKSKDSTHKFTIEQWNIKINGKKRFFAGFAIVPFGGSDIIE